jgi:uncharacterized protein YjbJ (UPF0337 family)
MLIEKIVSDQTLLWELDFVSNTYQNKKSEYAFKLRKFILNVKLINMNTTELKGDWEVQKGKLKQKFAQLTDNDLLFVEGKKDEMLGKLQITLGKSKEELQKLIEKL